LTVWGEFRCGLALERGEKRRQGAALQKSAHRTPRRGRLRLQRGEGDDGGRAGGGEEVADAAAPEEQEKNADEDERETETDPEAESAPVAAEAKVGAKRETDQPVGAEVTEHGSARVPGAAKSTSGDGLDAVEELKSSAGSEENDGIADDGGIRSVDAGDIARKDEKSNAHARHEGGAEKNGSVASIARAGGVAASNGLANTNGGSGRNAEGNHIGEGDGVKSDLMGGESDGTESRDERSDESEDADFGGQLKRGRKAKSDEAANTLKVGLNRSFEEFGLVARVVPEQVDDEDESEVGAGDRGGDAGTSNAEGGEAEFAEDEDVIAKDVDEVGGDESEGDGADHVHALKSAANGEVEKERKKSGGESAHVGSGEDSNVVTDAKAFEVERKEPDRRGEERSDGETEIDAVEKRAVAVFAVAGTEGLGHERIQADHEAFAKKGEDDVQTGADADGADGLGAVGETADHHRVHDDHAHPADFGENERESKAKGGAKLAAEDLGEGHGGVRKIADMKWIADFRYQPRDCEARRNG
jgi:hypothetical protein